MPYIDQATPNGDSEIAKELWRPSSPESTRIFQFLSQVAEKYGLSLKTYDDLWQWSVSEPAHFWGEVSRFTNVKFHKTHDNVRQSVHLSIRQAGPAMTACACAPSFVGRC